MVACDTRQASVTKAGSIGPQTIVSCTKSWPPPRRLRRRAESLPLSKLAFIKVRFMLEGCAYSFSPGQGVFLSMLTISTRSLLSKKKSTHSFPIPMHEQMLSISSLLPYGHCSGTWRVYAECVISGPSQIDERCKRTSFISCCPKE